MSLRMIILLGIFVWAPMMGYLVWKYLQTYKVGARATRRRALVPAGDEHRLTYDTRRRMVRRY